MNCVLVDVGNTSTVVALGRAGRISRRERLPTADTTPAAVDEILDRIGQRVKLDGVMVSSVVPRVNPRWRAGTRRVLHVPSLFVSRTLDLGVKIDYPQPARIGADRFANASAALQLYGSPCIVADFGTALTFDVIDERGAYVGGVIAPGLPFMTDYLAEKTALLPRIHLRGHLSRVGRSTEGAMRIGAKIGYRGMVREIVHYLSQGMGDHEVNLCGTGGFAEWALQGLDMPFVFNPDLTLQGIARIFELNATDCGSD